MAGLHEEALNLIASERYVHGPIRAGRSPQLTSEDLPLPEAPTTARNRAVAGGERRVASAKAASQGF